MPTKKPSPFNPHPSSLIPLYLWHGARPRILDQPPEQAGRLVCLLFAREGECCLLPIAWHEELPDPLQSVPWHQPQPLASGTLPPETMRYLEAILLGDGWQLTGRLLLQFTGREAVADFQQYINHLLNTHPQESQWS